jgi:hypothetical protein
VLPMAAEAGGSIRRATADFGAGVAESAGNRPDPLRGCSGGGGPITSASGFAWDPTWAALAGCTHMEPARAAGLLWVPSKGGWGACTGAVRCWRGAV